MRFPRRSERSLSSQQLPSVLTLFPTSQPPSTHIPVKNTKRTIEDGIELVPIERQDTSNAEILPPGQEEKQVVVASKSDLEFAPKPLPNLPRSKWDRMSAKYRIIVIICVQLCMLLTVGLSLMAVGKRRPQLHSSSEAEFSNSITVFTPKFPVDRGTFGIMMRSPQQQNSACLPQSNETMAWACAPGIFRISILPAPSEQVNNSEIILERIALHNDTEYGRQDFISEPSILTPIVDSEYPENGPAFHFQIAYNRVLLLQERLVGDALSSMYMPDWGEYIKPGERPWSCVFNNTIIEGAIYVSRNATWANTPLFDPDRPIPTLPYVVKLTERPMTNSAQAYCVRKEVLADGTLVNAENDGTMNMLHLSPSGECRCQWMVQ